MADEKQHLLFEETEIPEDIQTKLKDIDVDAEMKKIENLTAVVSQAMADSRQISEEFKELFEQIDKLTPMLERIEKLD
tara:strand:+ start:114 stop:347 length:234 start_codon:yes stop_codon:yes gene_type:complete